MRSEIKELRNLLSEEMVPAKVVSQADDIVDVLSDARKRLGSLGKDLDKGPLSDYLRGMVEELGDVLRQGVIDVEKAVALMSGD
jgi:hypothetical protein